MLRPSSSGKANGRQRFQSPSLAAVFPLGLSGGVLSERRLLAASDVLALRDPRWLADYVIPERSISMLWGPPNIGKSFVTLDLACSVAVGNDWMGRAVEPGRVVYVAGEGVHSFKRRLGAWLRYNSLDEEDLGNLSFVGWPVQLHEGIETFLRLVRPADPVLVIIDTLAASSLGVDEDKTAGIGPVMKSLQKIRSELEAAVMVVHHTGWIEEHERGSSALRGTMDTSIRMAGRRIKNDTYDTTWKHNRKNTARSLVCEKQRDAEKFHDLNLRLHEVRWDVPKRKGSREMRTVKSLVPGLA